MQFWPEGLQAIFLTNGLTHFFFLFRPAAAICWNRFLPNFFRPMLAASASGLRAPFLRSDALSFLNRLPDPSFAFFAIVYSLERKLTCGCPDLCFSQSEIIRGDDPLRNQRLPEYWV
jgi:hypothetical protein